VTGAWCSKARWEGVSGGFVVGWEAEMQFIATIASIYTMVVSAAAAEAADLTCKVRPRARFAVAWSKLFSG
jgi:hypothetical protein